jgi:uncharacterized protein YbjQ (UPF0145 family)
MITCSSTTVAGYRVTKTIGLATGSTIRARHIGKDILAVFKNMIGGEIEEYSKMLGEAREQALDRMCAHAKELGANAVIAVRFSSSYVMGSASEILAYGTAVTIEPDTS